MLLNCFCMFLPTEVKYMIYDYLYGTVVYKYNLVMKDIYKISYSFTCHNPDSNILLILSRNNLVNISYWNQLWCDEFYNRFFDYKYCKSMLKKNISINSIPRIFINFSMIQYTNIFMDIK